MTLTELSRCYEEAAQPLRARLRELRIMLARAEDPEEIWHIKRRIAELTPMLTQMNELAELTARYYERGYYRNEKYTLRGVSGTPAAPGGTASAGQAGDRGGADGYTAGNADGLLLSGADHDPDRPGPGCE